MDKVEVAVRTPPPPYSPERPPPPYVLDATKLDDLNGNKLVEKDENNCSMVAVQQVSLRPFTTGSVPPAVIHPQLITKPITPATNTSQGINPFIGEFFFFK